MENTNFPQSHVTCFLPFISELPPDTFTEKNVPTVIKMVILPNHAPNPKEILFVSFVQKKVIGIGSVQANVVYDVVNRENLIVKIVANAVI